MKRLKNLISTLTVLLLFSHISMAQPKPHSFEQVDVLQKAANRNTVVFIYTDWCQYCKVMKKTALNNEQIVRILNNQFYFVALNGEEKKDIRFNDHLFKFKPNGLHTGTHELAEALGTIEGKIAYPVLVVLNSKQEIIFRYSGFLDARSLRTMLYNMVK